MTPRMNCRVESSCSRRTRLGTRQSNRPPLPLRRKSTSSLVEAIHRFPNTPVRVQGRLYWDTLRLWHEIQHGIGIATRERKLTLDGIGIDTWGVDYGLLGEDGTLCANPRHYRDARNNGMMEK